MELPLERDFAGNYGEVKALEVFLYVIAKGESLEAICLNRIKKDPQYGGSFFESWEIVLSALLCSLCRTLLQNDRDSDRSDEDEAGDKAKG